ncbi:MAG TPA: 23S rRNA (adenine(2503)-C(2))-methyltransferase RlmN, partial [Candidatus Binatia bacterium]|nr:23S rRNA (adenine(2503)-C(2))-methyltransferase RlmN [Candidatus Binatia bacterium]
MSTTRNIKELAPEALAAWLAAEGQAPYRARQVLQWIYRKGAESFAMMSDLPSDLRERLAAAFSIPAPRVVRLVRAADSTRKFLFALGDDARVESVLIPAEQSE